MLQQSQFVCAPCNAYHSHAVSKAGLGVIGDYSVRVCVLVSREGYYCPDSSVELLCPKGFYCPEGSSHPKQCRLLAPCPAGTVKPRLSWLALVLLALVCGAAGAVWWSLTYCEGSGGCNCMEGSVKDAVRDRGDARHAAMEEIHALLGKWSKS